MQIWMMEIWILPIAADPVEKKEAVQAELWTLIDSRQLLMNIHRRPGFYKLSLADIDT
jgi:hypothetical protein